MFFFWLQFIHKKCFCCEEFKRLKFGFDWMLVLAVCHCEMMG